MNKCQFIGRIASDLELKHIPSGKAVLSFSLAVNESWKDQDGNRQEKTEWIRVAAWGKQAETIHKYLPKGSPVYIEGKMRTREYEKNNVKHYITEIQLDSFEFLPSIPVKKVEKTVSNTKDVDPEWIREEKPKSGVEKELDDIFEI